MSRLNWNRVSKVAEEYVPYNKNCFKKKKPRTKPQTEAQKKRVEKYLQQENKESVSIDAIGKCTSCLSFNLKIIKEKNVYLSEVQCQVCKLVFEIPNILLTKVHSD